MAELTANTCYSPVVREDRKVLVIITVATADSADTIDLADATVTGGDTLNSVDAVISCFDATTGDHVTATVSGAVVTIDSAGATTDHVYVLQVIGK